MDEDESFWNSFYESEPEPDDTYTTFCLFEKFIRFWTFIALQNEDVANMNDDDINDFIDNPSMNSLHPFHINYILQTNVSNFNKTPTSLKRSRSQYDINESRFIFQFDEDYDIDFEGLDNPKKKYNSVTKIKRKETDYFALRFLNALLTLPKYQMIYMLVKGPSIIPDKYKDLYKKTVSIFQINFLFVPAVRFYQQKFAKDPLFMHLNCFGIFEDKCHICADEKYYLLFQHGNECPLYFCENCITKHINYQVQQLGKIQIGCMHVDCHFTYPFELVWHFLTSENRIIFTNIKNSTEETKTNKRCPNCLQFYQLSEEEVKLKKHLKGFKYRNGLNVVCQKCEFEWCFKCQSPLHDSIPCRSNRNTDKRVLKWANQRHGRYENEILKRARRCPKCNLLTEKNGGCLHMKCTVCDIDWCFSCGKRMLEIKLIPGFSHNCRYTFFGCPRLIKNPFKRILIRSAVTVGVSLLIPIAVPIVIVATPCAIGGFLCIAYCRSL